MKKKETPEEFAVKIEQYFYTRRILKRDKQGEAIMGADGAFQYDERPYTVTGLALALGFSSREELFSVNDRHKKALVGRALLRVEESAEEKLFNKDSFNGTRLFLATNFQRWNESARKSEEPESDGDLGVCSVWAG